MQSPCGDNDGLGSELKHFFLLFAVVVVGVGGRSTSGGHLERLVFQDSDVSSACAFQEKTFRCFLLYFFNYFSRDILQAVEIKSEK